MSGLFSLSPCCSVNWVSCQWARSCPCATTANKTLAPNANLSISGTWRIRSQEGAERYGPLCCKCPIELISLKLLSRGRGRGDFVGIMDQRQIFVCASTTSALNQAYRRRARRVPLVLFLAASKSISLVAVCGVSITIVKLRYINSKQDEVCLCASIANRKKTLLLLIGWKIFNSFMEAWAMKRDCSVCGVWDRMTDIFWSQHIDYYEHHVFWSQHID